jgi:hypothetical protein
MNEYLDFHAGRRLIGELFQVPKRGGITVSTPDLHFLMDLYTTPKTELKQRYISWTGETFLQGVHPSTKKHVINNFFRAWATS